MEWAHADETTPTKQMQTKVVYLFHSSPSSFNDITARHYQYSCNFELGEKFGNTEDSKGDDKKQEAADLDVEEDDEGLADARLVAQSLIKEAEEDDNDLGAEVFNEELPDASDLVVDST
ncbi:hypothetical protein M422DRAFT_249804 [Sphaerobolus stellatus SS14]|uniref:Unplaced genomic scaffold SPHSTscaffold_31, whole genome shotgun sequence n=1 Tax=Sphaerobolus stellatus (strain SS14) TaxID=990650 RepID=A0A0C9W3N2_SPHS4|nr:hypothetical protein M422DRAFT_249804 [Sphaerobolus stellatus SS14]